MHFEKAGQVEKKQKALIAKKFVKVYISSCFILLLISCSHKNYHDGDYKGTVVDPNNWLNFHDEILEVRGDHITCKKYTLSNSFAGETIVECEQFPDRIEFKEAGIVKVLRFDSTDSTLKLNDLVRYKLIRDDDMTLEKQSLRTPITKNDKKTVNLVQQTKAELKEFIPFQGARGYCSFEYEDDCLDVTIKDHQLTIRDLYDEGVICEGIIVHGKVLNAEGKELEVMLKPFELKLKRDGKWITFHELKRPDVE